MRYCDHCGAEIPEFARFCRNCGSFAGSEVKNVIDVIHPSPLNPPSPDTPPPLASSSDLPVEGAPPGASDADETIKNTWSAEKAFDLQTWHYLDRRSDEYQTIGPEVIAPLAAGGLVQIPASNVPVVPGTPQMGSVPAVQGTPQMGNGPAVQGNLHPAGQAPAPHELAHQAPSSPAPQHGWTWEHQPTPPHHQQHQPIHHQQHSMPVEQHHPAPQKRWWRRHERTHHEHAQTRPAHKFHPGHAHHTGAITASKAATGIAMKWAIIVLAAVVVMTSGGIIFVLASSPALSLSSSGTVSVGGILQLHGRGFVPGGSITLTVDNGLPATLAESRSARSDSGAANVANMLNNEQAQISNGAIAVSLTGTFDANVVAQSSWPAGRNILHAKESTGSRSADVPFILQTQPARLVINPATLDFGIIPQGNRVAESVLIGDTGGSSLNWNATTDGSPWLALQSSSGTLQPNGAQDALYALVDTGKLKQGTYNATISIHSNGGDAQIAVRLRVGPPVTTRQAQLNVNPANLDFGQLTPGQQVTDTLTIGNQGTLALQWQGSVSGASWLSLSLASGSVQPGSIPQNVQVTVDTRNSSLQAGSNTASIIVHSNGGNVTIPVTLTLLSSTTPTPSPSPSPTLSPSPTSIPSPSPTPSPTPTTPPPPSPSPTPTPVIQVAPVNIDPNSSGCSQNSDRTYTCAVTLSESTAGNLNWLAPAGIGGTNITFSPSSGQLSPGQPSQQVMIASIPCASNSFTFTDQNNKTATVNWSCTVQQPTGTASLGSCSYSAGSGWSCPIAIAASASNQVPWPWTASSSGVNGIGINPSSGSLPPGQSITATVTIPDMLCPASATITISGGASNIPLNWSCSAPALGVTVNTPTCPGDSTNGWTCTITLFLTSGSQGQLTWTSSVSNNLPKASLSPAGGTISAGQQITVTISIPGNDCTNGSFIFSGSDGSNATVTWTCPQTG